MLLLFRLGFFNSPERRANVRYVLVVVLYVAFALLNLSFFAFEIISYLFFCEEYRWQRNYYPPSKRFRVSCHFCRFLVLRRKFRWTLEYCGLRNTRYPAYPPRRRSGLPLVHQIVHPIISHFLLLSVVYEKHCLQFPSIFWVEWWPSFSLWLRHT